MRREFSSEGCADAMCAAAITDEIENHVDNAFIAQQREQIDTLRSIVDFVDSWVSNPVSAYSIAALDGLFSMTRERIAALRQEKSQ